MENRGRGVPPCIGNVERRVVLSRGGIISPEAARRASRPPKRKRRREAPARTAQGRREQLVRASEGLGPVVPRYAVKLEPRREEPQPQPSPVSVPWW